MDKAADLFLMNHGQPDFITGLFALVLVICCVTAFLSLGLVIVEVIIQPWLDRREARKRLPKAERRPDYMQHEMKEEYENASKR